MSSFTVPLILGSVPLGDFYQPGSCGLDFLGKWVSGLVPVFVVSGARFKPMFMLPSRQFSHVHLDLVGPLPSRHGFTYLLTMIDRTS